MTTYSVDRQVPHLSEPVTEKVRAERVEIKEGGVLAFYGEPNENEDISLGHAARNNDLVVAYSEWDAFSKDYEQEDESG